MMFTVLSHFIVRIPLAYILSPKIGLQGIWISMTISNLFNMIFHLAYYYSNKWQKNANITLNSFAKKGQISFIINLLEALLFYIFTQLILRILLHKFYLQQFFIYYFFCFIITALYKNIFIQTLFNINTKFLISYLFQNSINNYSI